MSSTKSLPGQPSVIQCSMAKLELTFPNTAANDATTGDLTTDGG